MIKTLPNIGTFGQACLRSDDCRSWLNNHHRLHLRLLLPGFIGKETRFNRKITMSILYFTYPLSAVLVFCMALGVGFYLTRRFQLSWRLYWIGGAGFILSQVGHIPFNRLLTSLFQQGILPVPPENWQLLFNAVVLGLSAGLWEELIRYGVFRWWAKQARSWPKALLLGSGHGGIEAIAIGGIILLTYVQMVALRTADLAALVPTEQAASLQQAVTTYWSAPWVLSLMGALERALTLPAHIAFSVLVYQVFARKQIRWLWFAVGWHALIDAVVVYTSAHLGIYATEALIGVSTVINVGMIMALKPARPEPQAEESLPTLENAPIPSVPEVEESSENLEKTRFH